MFNLLLFCLYDIAVSQVVQETSGRTHFFPSPNIAKNLCPTFSHSALNITMIFLMTSETLFEVLSIGIVLLCQNTFFSHILMDHFCVLKFFEYQFLAFFWVENYKKF